MSQFFYYYHPKKKFIIIDDEQSVNFLYKKEGIECLGECIDRTKEELINCLNKSNRSEIAKMVTEKLFKHLKLRNDADVLYYYYHAESDGFVIMSKGERAVGWDELNEIGEVKERTLEELVHYLMKEQYDESIFKLIDDDVVKQLELK